MSDQQKIIEAIAEDLILPTADIDLHASLQDDLGLNPVEIADLLHNLSNTFKLVFDPYETSQLKTVGDLVVMIEDKLLD